jgi:hypothetical protein
MKNKLFKLVVFVVVAALVFSSCAPSASVVGNSSVATPVTTIISPTLEPLYEPFPAIIPTQQTYTMPQNAWDWLKDCDVRGVAFRVYDAGNNDGTGDIWHMAILPGGGWLARSWAKVTNRWGKPMDDFYWVNSLDRIQGKYAYDDAYVFNKNGIFATGSFNPGDGKHQVQHPFCKESNLYGAYEIEWSDALHYLFEYKFMDPKLSEFPQSVVVFKGRELSQDEMITLMRAPYARNGSFYRAEEGYEVWSTPSILGFPDSAKFSQNSPISQSLVETRDNVIMDIGQLPIDTELVALVTGHDAVKRAERFVITRDYFANSEAAILLVPLTEEENDDLMLTDWIGNTNMYWVHSNPYKIGDYMSIDLWLAPDENSAMDMQKAREVLQGWSQNIISSCNRLDSAGSFNFDQNYANRFYAQKNKPDQECAKAMDISDN